MVFICHQVGIFSAGIGFTPNRHYRIFGFRFVAGRPCEPRLSTAFRLWNKNLQGFGRSSIALPSQPFKPGIFRAVQGGACRQRHCPGKSASGPRGMAR